METLTDLWNSLDFSAILSTASRLIAIFLCLTVHETCHGLAAYTLGDPTAKSMKRLSLNPLHHIDWMGFAAMLFLGFGWAKPVPVDMRYFRKPKQGMAVTALAGPLSNLLLALLLIFFSKLLEPHVKSLFALYIYEFLLTTAALSVGLGIFNMIPVPPLDGSKVLFALLPDEKYITLMRYERYGTLLLYALIFLGVFDNFLGRAVNEVFLFLLNLIY